MKVFIKSLMILQIILWLVGCWQISQEEYFFGIFNVTINLIFFIVNIFTLHNYD